MLLLLLLPLTRARVPWQGLSYLEAKHLMMLQYCAHIIFYILLKAEGRPVRDHPVMQRCAAGHPVAADPPVTLAPCWRKCLLRSQHHLAHVGGLQASRDPHMPGEDPAH